MTVEELLDKMRTPNGWFREADAYEKRQRYIMEQIQKQFPGNYKLEEYYNPDKMCFKYRLKFESEAEEMWFKLKWS